MLANKRREAARLSSPDYSFASVPLKIFDGNTMLNIKRSGANAAHFQIIRRSGALSTVQAVGAPTLRAGHSAFTQPIGTALQPILALRAMVRALTSMLAVRRSSAPPGRVQGPPRPMVPQRWRWGSVLAVRGVEGGAA